MAKKKHGLYSDENAIFGQNGGNPYHGGYEHSSAQVDGSSGIHNVAHGLSDGGGHFLVQNADVSSMKVVDTCACSLKSIYTGTTYVVLSGLVASLKLLGVP